jgi:hypothetical protein
MITPFQVLLISPRSCTMHANFSAHGAKTKLPSGWRPLGVEFGNSGRITRRTNVKGCVVWRTTNHPQKKTIGGSPTPQGAFATFNLHSYKLSCPCMA